MPLGTISGLCRRPARTGTCAVVNHLAGENRWAPPLFAGGTGEEVGDRYQGNLVGDDPVAAWDDSAAAAATAVDGPDALDRIVRLSFGDVPGHEYAMQLFADLLVHGWDLAHAIGAEERLDPELVDACAAWFAGVADAHCAAGAVPARRRRRVPTRRPSCSHTSDAPRPRPADTPAGAATAGSRLVVTKRTPTDWPSDAADRVVGGVPAGCARRLVAAVAGLGA